MIPALKDLHAGFETGWRFCVAFKAKLSASKLKV